MTELTPEQRIEEAKSVLRAEYYGSVRDSAQEIAEECRKGEISDREALIERIDSECDGSHWVVYTFAAQQVLMFSDNDSAGVDELGADGFDWSGGVPWSQLAYFAMRADLCEQLEAEGIDLNADSWSDDAESDE